VYILQNKYLGDHIPEASKKNSENQDKRSNSHVLVIVKYSPNACILYSSASHKMFEIENVLYSIYACMGPPILRGYDTPVDVIFQGRA
jgi:hypothetical protein